METLLFARHGLAGSNRDGTASCAAPGEGLTPDGVEQARGLGQLLRGEDVALGVATELARTQETLALALAGRDVQRLIVPELNEIGFGAFDAGPLAEYRAWAASHSPSEAAPGGGESRADAAARFARGLRLVLERPEGVVLVACHALFLRYVLDAARGLVPAPVMAPIEHAVPHRLAASEVVAAVQLLERWSLEPQFRDPSIEGREGYSAFRPPSG